MPACVMRPSATRPASSHALRVAFTVPRERSLSLVSWRWETSSSKPAIALRRQNSLFLRTMINLSNVTDALGTS